MNVDSGVPMPAWLADLLRRYLAEHGYPGWEVDSLLLPTAVPGVAQIGLRRRGDRHVVRAEARLETVAWVYETPTKARVITRLGFAPLAEDR